MQEANLGSGNKCRLTKSAWSICTEVSMAASLSAHGLIATCNKTEERWSRGHMITSKRRIILEGIKMAFSIAVHTPILKELGSSTYLFTNRL